MNNDFIPKIINQKRKVNTIIKDILDYKNIFEEIFNKPFDKEETLYFRGESKEFDMRTPSLYLNEDLTMKGSERYYRTLMNELGTNDYEYNTSLARMMSELQHYGAKTRMLDITKNPLIALYFAVEKDDEFPGYVYLFHSKNDEKFDTGHTVAIKTAMSLMPQSVINNFFDACKEIKEAGNDIQTLSLEDIRNSKDLKKFLNPIQKFMELINQRARTRERLKFPIRIYEDLKVAHIVSPSKVTDRIRQQQGAFIFPCFVNTENRTFIKVQEEIHNSINELSASIYIKKKDKDDQTNKEVTKFFEISIIKINGGDKKNIRNELKMLGFSPGFIFPDIEHQSKAILD